MTPDYLPLGTGEHGVKPRLKAIGIGGAGCNAISSCSFDAVGLCTSRGQQHLSPRQRHLVLTDEQVRLIGSTPHRLLWTVEHESVKRIKEALGENDLVFLFTGLGGELGSVITPGVASLCRRQAGLVIVSAALPFSVEGTGRRQTAADSLPGVIEAAHGTITYPNDGLLQMAPSMPLHKAFKAMDTIMMMPAIELAQVLTQDDLRELRSEFTKSKHLRMGIGVGQGIRKEELAVQDALTSPWFDFPLDRVSNVLTVVSGDNVNEYAMKSVLKNITSRLPRARVRYAARNDPELKDRLKVLLLIGLVER
jgi:cell division protein FtsZ